MHLLASLLHPVHTFITLQPSMPHASSLLVALPQEHFKCNSSIFVDHALLSPWVLPVRLLCAGAAFDAALVLEDDL